MSNSFNARCQLLSLAALLLSAWYPSQLNCPPSTTSMDPLAVHPLPRLDIGWDLKQTVVNVTSLLANTDLLFSVIICFLKKKTVTDEKADDPQQQWVAYNKDDYSFWADNKERRTKRGDQHWSLSPCQWYVFLSFFLSLLHNWQRGLFLRTTTLTSSTTEEVMATSDWLGRQTLTTNREEWRSCRNRGTGLEPKRASSPSSRFSFFFSN